MRSFWVAMVLWVFAVPVSAQDFNTGMAAYKSGNFSTALEEWEPLAEQGNAFAQFNLGVMYDYGYGVPKDFILAHLWFDLAGTNDHKDGFKNRDVMAQKMSDEDISKAQAMAVKCLDSAYQDCGH